MCSSRSSVRVAVPPSLLRRCSALPHTVALHIVALLIAEVVVAPILIGSLRPSSHRSSFVVALRLARRRLCPTAHRCPVAPLRRTVLDGTAIPRRYDSTTPITLISFRFATFVFWQKICHAIDHPRRNLEPILEATLESYPIGAILEAYVHVIKWSSDHMFN